MLKIRNIFIVENLLTISHFSLFSNTVAHTYEKQFSATAIKFKRWVKKTSFKLVLPQNTEEMEVVDAPNFIIPLYHRMFIIHRLYIIH